MQTVFLIFKVLFGLAAFGVVFYLLIIKKTTAVDMAVGEDCDEAFKNDPTLSDIAKDEILKPIAPLVDSNKPYTTTDPVVENGETETISWEVIKNNRTKK